MRNCAFAIVLCCCIGPVHGQSDSRVDWTPEQWTEHFKLEAKEYKLTQRQSGRVLELHSKPLLNWTNPSNHQGLVFYWTLDGRPEVICSLFKYMVGNMPREKHAMHSLSELPLTADLRGSQVWAPEEPGLSWFEPKVAAATLESASPLLQMRSVSRLYKVKMTERDGTVSELRLLPTPLLEYSSPSKKILQGAIFAYATATDPDAMLIVEILEDAGKRRIQGSFARSHYLALRAFDSNGTEIWSVPFDDMSFNPAGSKVHLAKPYCSFTPVPR